MTTPIPQDVIDLIPTDMRIFIWRCPSTHLFWVGVAEFNCAYFGHIADPDIVTQTNQAALWEYLQGDGEWLPFLAAPSMTGASRALASRLDCLLATIGDSWPHYVTDAYAAISRMLDAGELVSRIDTGTVPKQPFCQTYSNLTKRAQS